MKNIAIAPYNSNWPNQFDIEATAIKKALGDNLIAIHHIGSTSVPGLAAKPKIDVIAVVKDPSGAIGKLEKIGIDYRGEYNIPLHYGFSKRGEIDLNLHVYQEGHAEIELNILFRDFLRSNFAARDEYANLKKNLLSDTSSFEKNNSVFTNYTLKKGDFIRKILKQAGYNQLRILKCNDETEWAAAQNFRQKYFFAPNKTNDPYTWTFNHPEHAHLILYLGTEIIGYAHIQLWPDKRAAMRIIVIDENKRKNGYGGRFLALCEKWLKNLNFKSIHAESSPTALTFYKKYDYVEMSFNYPDNYSSDPSDTPVGKILY